MDTTVAVAAMGFATTLLATWMTGRFQGRADRDGRILEARVRVYGECSDSLYEYARATYNRAKARLELRPEVDREILRQEAYRCNARARSAIGQALILSGEQHLGEKLSSVRHEIGELKHASDETDLKRRQSEIYDRLKEALDAARGDLTI